MANARTSTNGGNAERMILPPGVNLAALRSGSHSSGEVRAYGRGILSRILIGILWRVVSWLFTRIVLLGGILGAAWWYWGSGLTALPSFPIELSNYLDPEAWTDLLRKLKD